MTYDYACGACNHIWQAEQKITEPALDTCPRCGAKEARRLISGGGAFQLMGKGWAKDGYK